MSQRSAFMEYREIIYFMENYLNYKLDALKLSKMFDELPLWSAPFGLKLLDFIEYKHKITAIDLGFGTGFPLIEIAMRLGSESVIYGIDIWKEAFDKVNEKIEYLGIKNIRLIEGNIESIPLESNFVDLITSNNCINNVENLNCALMECNRIIKKNGQFLITMNLEKTMFEFYNLLEKILLELNLINEIEQMHRHIEQKRPSIDKILNPLYEDFLIKDIEYDQFNYKFSNGSSMLNHHFIKIAFMDSWKNIIPEHKRQMVFELVENRMNEQAKENGEIKLSVPFVLINCIKK